MNTPSFTRRLQGIWPRPAAALLASGFLLASEHAATASTAYGSLNNFDVINDTGGLCHGFEIEIEGVRSREVTYTYDWNHFGAPRIVEDLSNPVLPRVLVRYEAKKNPDGSYASFTNPQNPLAPLAPTDGHACTDPSVNLGCEHFGVGYYGAPSAVRYYWLVDDPFAPGTLVRGPAVMISTPSFTYYPPVPAPVVPADPPAAPARIEAVIVPPEPVEPLPGQFGVPVWVKILKTVQPSGKKVRLVELMSDDETRDDDANWNGEEAPETEIEWMVFQKRPIDNPGGDEIGGADDLPNGDETVTRRYEFYVYNGPANAEDGEAQCDDPDKCPGSVGDYIGSQMAGFNVEEPLGMIDHVQNGERDVPYVERRMIVGGNEPYSVKIVGGALPNGLDLGAETGILSGLPSVAGKFDFSVEATDADGAKVIKAYSLEVLAPLNILTADLPSGEEKAPYQATLSVEGGVPPYQWSVDALPDGLTLQPEGVIDGSPAVGTAGDHLISLSLVDAAGTRLDVQFWLSIAAAPVPPPVRGDLDGDRDVDWNDLAVLFSSRNRKVSGPDDPRDLDKDGFITVKDGRILSTLFTRPGGATR